jgi:hypothetical protein
VRSEDRWREGLRMIRPSVFARTELVAVLTAFLVTGVLAPNKTRSSHDNLLPSA